MPGAAFTLDAWKRPRCCQRPGPAFFSRLAPLPRGERGGAGGSAPWVVRGRVRGGGCRCGLARYLAWGDGSQKTQALGIYLAMPTIFRFGTYRVAIYTNDHRPAHVHVVGGGCEAVFHLHCPGGPPELRESLGLTAQGLNRIAVQLRAELAMLCHSWRTIHGDD